MAAVTGPAVAPATAMPDVSRDPATDEVLSTPVDFLVPDVMGRSRLQIA
jgi:hypothetical protein